MDSSAAVAEECKGGQRLMITTVSPASPGQPTAQSPEVMGFDSQTKGRTPVRTAQKQARAKATLQAATLAAHVG